MSSEIIKFVRTLFEKNQTTSCKDFKNEMCIELSATNEIFRQQSFVKILYFNGFHIFTEEN